MKLFEYNGKVLIITFDRLGDPQVAIASLDAIRHQLHLQMIADKAIDPKAADIYPQYLAYAIAYGSRNGTHPTDLYTIDTYYAMIASAFGLQPIEHTEELITAAIAASKAGSK